MKAALLLQLADLLDTVPEERFAYGSWFTGPGVTAGECGTTACALGWATRIPECGLAVVPTPEWSRAGHGRISHASGVYDIHAAMAAFDLNRDEAEMLFCPGPGEYCEELDSTSPGPEANARDVAQWIREVVEETS